MGRYPRTVRGARVKCVDCNAPAAQTIEHAFVCVECGREIISLGGDSSGGPAPADD